MEKSLKNGDTDEEMDKFPDEVDEFQQIPSHRTKAKSILKSDYGDKHSQKSFDHSSEDDKN